MSMFSTKKQCGKILTLLRLDGKNPVCVKPRKHDGDHESDTYVWRESSPGCFDYVKPKP